MGFHITHAPEASVDCCATYDRKIARRAIFEAWSDTCIYCGAPSPTTLDHLLPRHRGGISETSNLAPCCSRCNQSKGASLLEDWYPQSQVFSQENFDRIQSWRNQPWI